MPLTDSFPGPSGVVDSTELRKDLAGLIVRNADGSPRAGLFYRGASGIGTTRTGDMKVDLQLFSAALVRGGGPLFTQNDGVAQSPSLTVPSSNQIIHVVYAMQHEQASPYADADNLPTFGFVSTDQGATPDVNQAIGRLPSGALQLVSVQVPSTAVTTASAGVVIKDIAPFTSASGGMVPFRTKSDLDLWTTAAPYQEAVVLATGYRYMFVGGVWRLTLAGKSPFFRYHKAAAFTWQSTMGPVIWDSLVDGALDGWTYASGVFTCVIPGVWEFDGRAGINTGSASANVRWYRNGTADIGYGGGQHASAFTSHGCAYRKVFAVGDTVEMRIVSTSSQAGVLTDGGSQLTWLTARYLGLY